MRAGMGGEMMPDDEVWKGDGAPLTKRERKASNIVKLASFVVHHECVVELGGREGKGELGDARKKAAKGGGKKGGKGNKKKQQGK